MRASPARALLLLCADALRDGLRRRLVLVVATVTVLGLATAESCTSFGGGSFVVNGVELEAQTVASWLAPFLYGLEVLTVVVLAGLLAADHLVRPLDEGSAALWLARPIGRGTYAAGRLGGALGVALGAGAVLLAGTGALLVARHGLAREPALLGALAGALGAASVAALAMSASLLLGRIAVVALVVTLAPLIAFTNALAFVGVELEGWLGAVDQLAPPLATAVLAAVAAWNPHVPVPEGMLAGSLVQLALWALGSFALLVLLFRRVEIAH